MILVATFAQLNNDVSGDLRPVELKKERERERERKREREREAIKVR